MESEIDWGFFVLISKISTNVGAEVTEIDLRQNLSDENRDALSCTLANTGLLVIRSQNLEPAELLQFSRNIGEVRAYTRSSFELDGFPEILVLSNLEKDGKKVGSAVSGRVWHVDGHYLDEIPRATILSMKIVQKQGGNTSFTNMQAAYAKLPDRISDRVENLNVTISRVESRAYNYPDRAPATDEERASWKDVVHPVVLRHPVTGRGGLGVGGNVPWKIDGLDASEGIPLITFLQEWAARPEFSYEHVWREGDVLVWDNWTVMHKAAPYTGDRLLHRTTVF